MAAYAVAALQLCLDASGARMAPGDLALGALAHDARQHQGHQRQQHAPHGVSRESWRSCVDWVRYRVCKWIRHSRLQVQGMKAATRALCPTSFSRERSEDLLLFTFADVEGFLTLERGYEGASDAQHVAHKAVFDATAEALRAELAPVRASCSETLVAVQCPGQPHEQQVTGPTAPQHMCLCCLLIERGMAA